MWQPFALPPCSTKRSGPQRLGCCNGGFISPTSRSDAGSVLGPGKCSAHDRQHSPSSMPVNARGSASLWHLCRPFTAVLGSRSHPPHSAAHVRPCSAVVPAPALCVLPRVVAITPPSHLPASVMGPLASPLPPWSPSPSSSPPLWPPTPRHHAATDSTQDAQLRPAHMTSLRKCPRRCPCKYPHECPCACALALVRTTQTHHHNSQAVPRTRTRHRHHRQGQCASPGTCKHWPA